MSLKGGDILETEANTILVVPTDTIADETVVVTIDAKEFKLRIGDSLLFCRIFISNC
jgi:hypothetical protein